MIERERKRARERHQIRGREAEGLAFWSVFYGEGVMDSKGDGKYMRRKRSRAYIRQGGRERERERVRNSFSWCHD